MLKRLGAAIISMEIPAVEKISEEQQGTPFHVLIATMLSAQTRDAVTLEASTRLFKKAPTPRKMVKLETAEIERLIYPVSFYRNKAVHVKQTCERLLTVYGGVVPDTMEELLTLPGVGRKTANLVRIVAHRASGQHLRRHARPSHRAPLRLGEYAFTRGDRTRALQGDGEAVVGEHQPVSGDVGTAGLQAGLSALRHLRGPRSVSENRRHAARPDRVARFDGCR